MALSRHKAIVAGLALTLTLGTAAAPAVATLSNESPTTDTDPNGMGVPMPADYDKADFYQGTEGVSSFAKSRSASRLSAVGLSDEMKYFTKYESNCNYDQGLSYGDGYNAMGYYQFDRRYGLMSFIQQVYNQNPTKYSMFKSVLDNKATLSSDSYSMYDYNTKQLTGLAQDLDAAWHAAYQADPAEFSALQDAYAYNEYYLPVQSLLLNKYGVDVRNRADCVKGLVWGMCNLFGYTGVQNYFNDANISNDMTDRELVTALCETVIDRVTYYCSGQPQYHAGWQNRYRKELAVCLEYIAADEAEAEANKPSAPSNGLIAPSAPSADAPSADGPSADDAGSSDAAGPSATVPGAGNSTDISTDTSNSTNANNSVSNGGLVVDGSNGAGDSASNTTTTTPDASTSTGSSNSTSDVTSGDNSIVDDSAKADTTQTDTTQTDTDSEDTKSDEESGVQTEDTATETGAEATKDAETTKEADKQVKTTKSSDTTTTAKETKTTKDGLPQTGDIAGLVMTGAAGLAVAGGSFISLGKIEKKKRDDE